VSDTSAAETANFSTSAKMATARRWLPIANLVIALIAVALAIVGWFRPTSGPASFSDSQANDAKSQVCVAFLEVDQAVVTNTHRTNPEQGNPGSALGVAANARLALYAGGAYLKDRLANQPATPSDLAKAVESTANTMEALGIGYLANAPEANQQPLRDTLNSEIKQVKNLCK
jgi:hypothetical protein